MRASGKALVGLAGFVFAWQLVVWSGVISQDYLPGVPAIAAALAAQLQTQAFWANDGLTLSRAIAGLVLSVVTGLGAALLGLRYRFIQRALSPVVRVMQSLPPAALVPLSIFAIGLGMKLFIFIVWFAGVWTIYISAENAFGASDPVQLNSAASLGYSPSLLLWRVRLPAAMPEIFTGIRLASGGCFMAAIAAEMIAGENGLGYMLYNAAFSMRMADVFALLVVTGVNGLLLTRIVARLRQPLVSWHDGLTGLAEA